MAWRHDLRRPAKLRVPAGGRGLLPPNTWGSCVPWELPRCLRDARAARHRVSRLQVDGCFARKARLSLEGCREGPSAWLRGGIISLWVSNNRRAIRHSGATGLSRVPIACGADRRLGVFSVQSTWTGLSAPTRGRLSPRKHGSSTSCELPSAFVIRQARPRAARHVVSRLQVDWFRARLDFT